MVISVAKKEVNVSTANEFHIWQRANLPGSLIIQDLDNWVVAISDSKRNYEPRALIELKRSFSDVRQWSPYRADWPNYKALLTLSNRANLPFYTVYFKKGEPLKEVAWFRVLDVAESPQQEPWIHFERETLTASQLRDRLTQIGQS